MHFGADARVDAHGADIDAEATVTVDQIDRLLRAVQAGLQIAEQVFFRAEHAAKIVAGADGEGADCHIFPLRRTADAFVEGAVTAAGVNPQGLTALRLFADFAGGVHRRRRHIDFKAVRTAAKGALDHGANLVAFVAAAGDGVDNE